MEIVVNGEARAVAQGMTVADLVRSLSLDQGPCAVEVNQTLVRKAEHATWNLRPDDRVEIVTLVGGG